LEHPLANLQRKSKLASLGPSPLLEGLSDPVTVAIEEARHPALAQEQRAILKRMTTDKRMEKVWSELTRRERPSRAFVHQARKRDGAFPLSSDEAQSRALRELFYFVFCAARDKMSVWRPVDVKRSKERLLGNATVLRSTAQDLGAAHVRGQLGVVSPLDEQLAQLNINSLHMVANWLEHIASAHRRRDDPLMVTRQRGNPVVRAVQILVIRPAILTP
jgi:hypothetical protein